MLGNRKSSRVSCSIAEETRETYERLSQRSQTLKNALNFLVELKPLFHESFQGSQKQFKSRRLVMLRTAVYFTADLYQAKRQDKPRIVWRYKIHMLLLVNADGCGGGGENSHMKGAGMLVVSLRGAHFGFWSHLGCSEQSVIILSRKGLFYGFTRRYIFNSQFVLFTQFM